MGSEWKESTIGGEVLLQRGFDITKAEQVPGPVPVVSSSGISSFHTIAKVSAPGVVLGRKGVVGSVYYLDEDFWPHDTTLWVKDFKGNVPKFVYYYFRWQAPLLASMDVGSANPTLNRNHVHPIRTSWPSHAEQQRVAEVLTALDDKIELNRQTNQTLESMAQALFKSWFVDFDPVIDNALAAGNEIPDPLAAKAAARRALQEKGTNKASQPHTLPDSIRQLFPSRFQFTEELGWIPEGWESSPLDEVVDLIGGGTPKTSESDYWGGDIPWFSVVDAPNPSDVFVISTEKTITQSGLDNSSARLLPVGTTIISARGTVGKCAVAARPMAMNQSCYAVRGKDKISDSYVYYTVFLQVGDLQQRGHGSVFNTITRETFKTIRIPFGGEYLTQVFDEFAAGYFNRIKANQIQIGTLTSLRDLLLPKLLSGELHIPETEKMLGEALA